MRLFVRERSAASRLGSGHLQSLLVKYLYSIKTADLKQQYKALGADISRLLGDVEEFELLEDEDGLRIWSPQITGDSQFYSELAQNNSWYYLNDKREYDLAFGYIGDQSVLEVGCGEGHFALQKKFSAYIGLELNREAVKKATGQGLDVRLQSLQDYAREHPASVARVCSFQVLEHLPDPRAFLQAAHTVLQPDGLLITAVPSEDSFAGSIRSNGLNAPPHHITRWTDKCLRTLPIRQGFECLEIVHIPVEPVHYGWFWSTLLERALQGDNADLSRRQRVTGRILLRILISLGITSCVPEDFCIPGHTVLAVHRKLALPCSC